jgi:hypothetical protein
MANILLISGFKYAGKDYIVSHGYASYVILRHPRRTQLNLPDPVNLTRMKFATPLRSLLSPDGYFTPDGISSVEFEHNKDNQCFLPYDGTMRKLFIEIARATRLVDPTFFAKRLDMELANTDNVVITDWRYPNEHDYLHQHNNITTLRVHREYDHHGKKLNMPSEQDDSEHSLDSFKTDFIALPVKYYQDNYNGLIRRFPWASKYVEY